MLGKITSLYQYSVISDGGAETEQRGAETEKLVPKTPKLEVPKKVPKRVATFCTEIFMHI